MPLIDVFCADNDEIKPEIVYRVPSRLDDMDDETYHDLVADAHINLPNHLVIPGSRNNFSWTWLGLELPVQPGFTWSLTTRCTQILVCPPRPSIKLPSHRWRRRE
jgi:hypothetical protein